MTQEIQIPDIGDFKNVAVVEVLLRPGDRVTVGETLLILESDKATLDIPSSISGTVVDVLVRPGDRVSTGDPIARVVAAESAPLAAKVAKPEPATDAVVGHTQLVVIGGGPGGYTAAFRAADLGREVTLIDANATLGGVCLNVGCIPSKALLHLAKLRDDAVEARAHGLFFGQSEIDLAAVRSYKDGVVSQLTTGLSGLAKRRKVHIIRATARFLDAHRLQLTTSGGTSELRFDQAIVAVGSSPVVLPFLPDDSRIMDSIGALRLDAIPARLLVIGGGIIGLEMAQIYSAFGSRVDVVEVADQLLPGADADLVRPLAERLSARHSIFLKTRVVRIEAGEDLAVTLEGPDGITRTELYDRVLVAVGRSPNGRAISPEAAGIAVDGSGYIPVDAEMRTFQPHIFAVGDVVGQPMLAHKATHQAKIAAETACGHNATFEPASIPSVVYTDPEIAWTGLTEGTAKSGGIAVKVGRFPWAASGRALSIARREGMTKLLLDPANGRVLGGGMVGSGAGELIAEIALAVEMGATAEDLALTIHPHPTLSETVGLAADAYLGWLTDL